MKITRYEHDALTIEAGGKKIAIDFGCFSPESSVSRVGEVDAILVSHRHPDHFHAAHVQTLNAPVFAPKEVLDLLGENLVSQAITSNQPFIAAPGLLVTATNVDHGPKVTSPVVNFGFVIEADGRRVLFAGDMAAPSQVPAGPFDLVCVPVAGGGFVFDPGEALAFICQLGHSGKVLPMHECGPAQADCIATFMALAKGHCEVAALSTFQEMEV